MAFPVAFKSRFGLVFAVFLSDQFFVHLVVEIEDHFKACLQDQDTEKEYRDQACQCVVFGIKVSLQKTARR